MERTTPCLWFDTQGEDAANFYVSVFPNSRIFRVSHYGEAGPGPVGSVMTVDFELDARSYVALNGGPHFTFNEAVSFQITVPTRTRSTTTGASLARAARRARADG